MKKTELLPPAPERRGAPQPATGQRGGDSFARVWALAGLILVLGIAMIRPLAAVVRLAAESEVYSYILIVPFIAGYLCFTRAGEIPRRYCSSWLPALLPLAVGVASFYFFATSAAAHPAVGLSLFTFGFTSLLLAGVLLFLGWPLFRSLLFPLLFLYASVPLPPAAVEYLERALMLQSAHAADLFFQLFRVPVLRDGVYFSLPGVLIEVAQECSGIRSSLVLFLTALLAANFLLKNNWHRLILVLFVIPLGIVRNGFRVYFIGSMCVRYGPEFIHSPVHTRGGPLFFALSLIPLALLLWGMYRREQLSARRA